MNDQTKSQLAETMSRATQMTSAKRFPDPYKTVTDDLSQAARNRIITANRRIEIMASLPATTFK